MFAEYCVLYSVDLLSGVTVIRAILYFERITCILLGLISCFLLVVCVRASERQQERRMLTNYQHNKIVMIKVHISNDDYP